MTETQQGCTPIETVRAAVGRLSTFIVETAGIPGANNDIVARIPHIAYTIAANSGDPAAFKRWEAVFSSGWEDRIQEDVRFAKAVDKMGA